MDTEKLNGILESQEKDVALVPEKDQDDLSISISSMCSNKEWQE